MPLSRFIAELLEDQINAKDTGTTRRDLQNTISLTEDANKKLRSENVILSEQIERINKLIERYEEQIKQLKQDAWNHNKEFNGVREYEKRLIELLKDKKYIREEELLDLLHISPVNTNTTKAIMKQLETLLDYGVIKISKGGYQWQG